MRLSSPENKVNLILFGSFITILLLVRLIIYGCEPPFRTGFKGCKLKAQSITPMSYRRVLTVPFVLAM